MLELVGKETMDLLIAETGIEVEKNAKGTEQKADENQLFEEVTFDRCFYIYGGPEQLEVTSYFEVTHFCKKKKKKPRVIKNLETVSPGTRSIVQPLWFVI